MLSIGLSKALNRKEIQTIGNPSTNLLRTKQGRRNWELKNYSELEKILTRWQQAVFIMAQSQVFTEALYNFFSEKRNDIPGYDLTRLKDVLLYIQKKYGNYLRKDICANDLQLILSLDKDFQQGVIVEGNRIFPTVYYPYMDRQYFDHANWNKQPHSIAVVEVLANKDLISEIKLNTEKNTTCQCSKESSCGCKGNTKNNIDKLQPKIHQFSKHGPLIERLPVIHIGYTDLFGHSGTIQNAACYCVIQYGGGGGTLTVSYCGSGGKGGFCTYNYDCRSGNDQCRTKESQIPRD